ncbi:MAG: hypothetical protein IT515_03910 [Burkholderiales bacterium]|nr:hypothetical protein [Burkholderiales bacterium]
MPWTPTRFPASMQNLPDAVRAKAIEIANALLAEGSDEGRAIRIAIAKAKEWAQHEAVRPGAGRRPAR